MMFILGYNRICGRIGDVPPLQWQVENQQPETVTISMRNIGLDDDKSAGLSFTLQGLAPFKPLFLIKKQINELY